MSDRFWAKIWIGGPVPDSLMADLRGMLDDAGLVGPNEIIDDHIDDSGLLALEDSEAHYGWFEDLERWLEDHGIEFNRQSDGYADIEPEIVIHREGADRSVPLDHNGHPVFRLGDVLDLADKAPDLGALAVQLKHKAGLDLSPLRPFHGDAVPAALAADELKRRNTDPAAAACAQCGSPLADPGMGPAYRHCPRCEP